MKRTIVITMALLIASTAFAQRRPNPPKQIGIRSAPMQKQQGVPTDTAPAPASFSESAGGFRPSAKPSIYGVKP